MNNCCEPASDRVETKTCNPEDTMNSGPGKDSCCPPATQTPPVSTCGSSSELNCDSQTIDIGLPGYCIYPFVESWLNTPIGRVPRVSTLLTLPDRRGHWAVRWGMGRKNFLVTPGIYAVGNPNPHSHVFVSANYKFSFDCLRSSLKGENAWILIIDTKGVNVWCAAGKGTFGTDEIVAKIQQTQLSKLVDHRKLILPQLGAPGVAAYRVKQETGFSVIYGPVKASDLKTFLAHGLEATEDMRQVTFSFWERLVLTPVEVVLLAKKIFYSTLILFILSGIGADIFSFSLAWHRGVAATGAGLAGVLTGCVLTPALLPWLPTRSFASKGALMGLLTSTVLALGPNQSASLSGKVTLYLFILAISSYTAMNFTGSTTYTSPSGVEKEMRIAVPCQALAMLLAGLFWIIASF